MIKTHHAVTSKKPWLLTLAALFVVGGCSHNADKPTAAAVTLPPAETSSASDASANPTLDSASKAASSQIIDPEVLKKARPLFESLIRNNEKKAKLAYGRSVRHLPEIVQFAVDLRFKNYDHALTVLPKTNLSSNQKEFWQRLIQKKPSRLGLALCNELVAHPEFSSPGERAPDEETAWATQLNTWAQEMVAPAKKEVSEINQELGKVTCTEKEYHAETGNCGALNDDLQAELLSDSFFDTLHNSRRRDSQFWRSHYKSIIDVANYSPNVSDLLLFKFYRALKATTEAKKQVHFLKRFTSIARDMRSDTILSRSIAATILNDEVDRALAKRFGAFLFSNSLISVVTRIDGEIPRCQVPAPTPPTTTPVATPSPSP